jgi:uncharacterized protein YijF (DUF1287 family)
MASRLFFLLVLLSPLPSLAAPADIVAVLANAREQTTQTLYYDPGYTSLAYPGGDVPIERGVCTDVVIRAFRKAGVDLQVLVHQDMRKNFAAYPKLWGLSKPDRSIDHRRVPNLMTFFKRQGKALAVTDQAADYRAGDIVAWRLPNGLLHIGLVAEPNGTGQARPLIFHNIGQGARLEDILFSYEVIGHYRYF